MESAQGHRGPGSGPEPNAGDQDRKRGQVRGPKSKMGPDAGLESKAGPEGTEYETGIEGGDRDRNRTPGTGCGTGIEGGTGYWTGVWSKCIDAGMKYLYF